MTTYQCPKCNGQTQAVRGAQLWHPCPKNGGKQVQLQPVANTTLQSGPNTDSSGNPSSAVATK